MFKLALDSNELAPINQDAEQIMDVGAGRLAQVIPRFKGTDWTGFWAMEVAKEYPDAKVIGFDLSPTSRDDVPPNSTFEISDLNKDLGQYPDGTFDFVHSRHATWLKSLTSETSAVV
jgi:hypothetical protein